MQVFNVTEEENKKLSSQKPEGDTAFKDKGITDVVLQLITHLLSDFPIFHL